jgi:ribosomal protein S18 acetylase RimI-like enzyme
VLGGWLELHRMQPRRLQHVAVLTVAVAPAWRHRGLGRGLLRRCYVWARDVGVVKVSLNVRAGNAAAIALYLSEGFVEEGRERAQVRTDDGDLEDNVIMGRWVA